MSDSNPKKATAPRRPAGSGEMEDKIGAALRQLYEPIVKEAVPDRFIELLRQLEESSRQKKDDQK